MSTDWAEAMRAVARLGAVTATAIAEPDDLAAPVPWQRIGEGDRHTDVQILESALAGRKLLVIELDIGDDETERRILKAISRLRVRRQGSGGRCSCEHESTEACSSA